MTDPKRPPFTVADVPEEQNAQNDNLKAGLAEIKDILTRRDLAGHVIIYRNHLSKFVIKVDPSWSVLRIHDDGSMSLRSIKTDYAGDRDKQRADLEETVGMVLHLKELLQTNARAFRQVAEHLHHSLTARNFDVAHSPGVLTPEKDN